MGLELFNKLSRGQLFQQLASQQFDLLIIGGGITGASIFRDAALRGMRVALIEANDFAAGTSGRSSKLIHGGFRYLQNLKFRLVWESCHERNLQVRLNKRLVTPWPFLMPLYEGGSISRTKLRVGMWLYEMMSGFKNYRFHRFLGREETLLQAPGLRRQGLLGGMLYYDAIINDSRWTLETIKDGVRAGGIAINHAPVTGLIKDGNDVTGVTGYDSIGGAVYEVRSKAVVNATGVWADQIRKLDRAEAPDLVKLSRGAHLVFASSDVPLMVTIAFVSPVDGRALFLIKRGGCFLYGTTDNWTDASPDAPVPGREDVEYLLESLRLFMPDSHLNREQIQFIYSGFRGLPVTNGKELDPSSATREDLIEVAPSGLITVVGGKLTTARIMAIRVLEKVINRLGDSNRWSPCVTHRVPLGGDNQKVVEGFSSSEIAYVCRNEMVCTLEDLMERRLASLSWNNEERLERLRNLSVLIRDEMGMEEEEFEKGYRDYQQYLNRLHSVPLL